MMQIKINKNNCQACEGQKSWWLESNHSDSLLKERCVVDDKTVSEAIANNYSFLMKRRLSDEIMIIF